jgi:hypothetical protein
MRPQRKSYGTPSRRTKKARRAEAVLFLARARSLDGVTAEWLVARFDLTLATAEQMLSAARKVRA